jgi:hypothetical protein
MQKCCLRPDGDPERAVITLLVRQLSVTPAAHSETAPKHSRHPRPTARISGALRRARIEISGLDEGPE